MTLAIDGNISRIDSSYLDSVLRVEVTHTQLFIIQISKRNNHDTTEANLMALHFSNLGSQEFRHETAKIFQ